ncbi:MAG TPA: chemotaxis protein CheW [Blastocatellia bacterium]|nr:chemotaxis protein CheW [Blastocatellia bacterium]
MNDETFRQPEAPAELSVLQSLDQMLAATETTLAGSAEAPVTPAAEMLAAPLEKYLLFSLAEARYAIPVGNLLEVAKPESVTLLPRGPDWLKGVTSLRGEILSVIDCRAFFRLGAQASGGQSRLCVVATCSREITTALLVDRVEGMIHLAADQLNEPPGSVENQMLPFLSGVSEHKGHRVNVLNLEKLLHSLDTEF